jgi:hypothetical protein
MTRTDLQAADAAGWTLARFRTAAAELGSSLPIWEVDALRMQAWRQTWIPAPLRWSYAVVGGKERRTAHAGHADRLLMQVWRGFAEGPLDRILADPVHGFRRGRGPTSALRALTSVACPATMSLVRADVQEMFPSLHPRWMLGAIEKVWGPSDAFRPDLSLRLVGLARRWLTCWGGVGVPVGVSIAPLFANAYLAVGVDCWLTDALSSGLIHAGIRYADDFALVTDVPHRVLDDLRGACAACGLVLRASKTKIISVSTMTISAESVLGHELMWANGRLHSPGRTKKGRF